ncbi:MAG: tetratricopeptide repeat protein [Verrucomicrobiae bacterium]|nr:tetratricopeptide repeat protein [Verrucomicrobiae bacterium]
MTAKAGSASRIFLLLAGALFFYSGCSGENAKRERLRQRADSYYNDGRYDEARIEYENLLRYDQQDGYVLGRLGAIWLEQGAPLQAYRFLHDALLRTPGAGETRVRFGQLLQASGQMRDARSEAMRALDEARPGTALHDEALLLLTQTCVSGTELDDAERRLRSLGRPKTSALHLVWASFYLRKGDPEQAGRAIDDALRQEPDSAQAHFALAGRVAAQQGADAALNQYRKAAELAPLRSAVRLESIEFMLRNGDKEEARRRLREIVRDAPDSLGGWRLLAQLAFQDGDTDQARVCLNRLFSRNASDLEGRLLEARLLMGADREQEALQKLAAVRASYPQHPLFELPSARLGLLLGELHLALGQPDLAMAEMVNILQRHPDMAAAQFLLAEAYSDLGRSEDAKAVLVARIAADPEDARAHALLGLQLRGQNEFSKAREMLLKAEALAGDKTVVSLQLAELELADQDYAAALGRLNDGDAEVWQNAAKQFMLGQIYRGLGDTVKAEAALLRAIELQPEAFSAYGLLAEIYTVDGKMSQAVKLLQAFLAKHPQEVHARLKLAMAYEAMGHREKLQREYEAVLKQAPDAVPVLNNLALIYADDSSALDEALELAQRARALDPDNPSIADTLGWIACLRGDYPRALTLIREAVGRKPDSPLVQFHHGVVCYLMGRLDESNIAFTEAQGFVGDFPQRAEAAVFRALVQHPVGGQQLPPLGDVEAFLQKHRNDALAFLLLARVHEDGERFTEAADACTRAVEIAPDLLPAWIKLAQLTARDAPEKAIVFARKARALAPDDPVVAGVSGRIEWAQGNSAAAYPLLKANAGRPDAEPGELCDYAAVAWAQGNSSEAISIMQRVVANAIPGTAAANQATSLQRMLMFLIQGGDVANAELHAQDVLRRVPKDPLARMVCAAAQRERGAANSAEDIYRAILTDYPDFAQGQKELAKLCAAAAEDRRLEEAFRLAQQARRVLVDDPELALTLVDISIRRKDFEAANQLLAEMKGENALLAGARVQQSRQFPEVATVSPKVVLGAVMPGAVASTTLSGAVATAVSLDAESVDVIDAAQPVATPTPATPATPTPEDIDPPRVAASEADEASTSYPHPILPAVGPLSAVLKVIRKPDLETIRLQDGNVLGIVDYEVIGGKTVQSAASTIRVAHGFVLNGKLTRVAKREIGTTVSMDLVPVSDYPGLRKWHVVGGDLRGVYTPKM